MFKPIRLICATATVLSALAVQAIDFQTDGLYYTIIDANSRTVEVSKPTTGKYTMTEVLVPAKVINESDGIEYSVISIGEKAFYDVDCTSATIAEGVVELGKNAFGSTDYMTSITLPSTLRVIGEYALYYTGLETIELPEGLQEIKANGFYNNKKLKSITIPESCITLGEGVFSSCTNLTEVNVLAPITEIPNKFLEGNSAPNQNDIRHFTIPETVVRIGDYAFSKTRLESIDIPASVKEIGKKAFYISVMLKEVTLHNGLEAIGGAAFEECTALTEITIPGTVQTWGVDYGDYNNTFENCTKLAKVTFEEGVKEIPKYCFAFQKQGLASIHEIYLPSTLEKIGDKAFYNNTPWRAGAKIVFNNNTPLDYVDDKWGSSSLYNNCTIYVPADAAEAYKAHSVWGQFNNIVEMAAQTVEIPAEYLNVLGDTDSDSYASLTVTWGDDLAMDNLSSAVMFASGASVADVIETALAADPRFYALKDVEGNFVAFGFDTNGDNSAAVNVSGAALELKNGVATSNDYADATGSSVYDHWKVNADNATWLVFVNGEAADYTTTLSTGDDVSLVYSAETVTERAYTFYLHPAHEQGIWMLDDIVLDTANGKMQYFPMIANALDDWQYIYGAGIGLELLEGNYYSGYIANGAKGAMSCRITVNSPKPAQARAYLNIRKDWQGDGKLSAKRIYGNTFNLSTVVAKPITGISLQNIEAGSTIILDNMGVLAVVPVIEPADADFPKDFSFSFADEKIANIYSNVNTIVAHSEGTTNMILATGDGSVSSSYTIVVNGINPDNKPADEYQDGVVWLNEEWFGHTSGSLNYIANDGSVFYRAYGNQNGNTAFGCTSQFGTIYAGKLIVMSKQAWDGGDTRPEAQRVGGRVVVADATSMKRLGGIDDIGGDGRSCVGVNPSKVYLGTTTGIRVMDLDNYTVADANIAGISLSRNGQIGDMVKAGKYVFAANIGTGLSIIDTETDTFVKTIASTGIQTVTQSMDGRVWYSEGKNLIPVDPVTLEAGSPYSIPGSITCSSGSWRHGNLMASTTSNTLLWGTGTFYRWNLDEIEDPSTLSPVFTHVSKQGDITYGNGYGAPGYDSRTDTYMYATMPGFGLQALKNWYHFVDATTGEVKHIEQLPDYWWFPAMPIFPDKHLPSIDIEDYEVAEDDEATIFDLNQVVDDPDNHNYNISVSLADATTYDATSPAAEVTLSGKNLTVKPLATGRHTFTLLAESNGRVASKDVTVTVKNLSGIASTEVNNGFISCSDHTLSIAGFEGTVATVSDMAGSAVATFNVDDNHFSAELPLSAGIYIVSLDNGHNAKIVIR